MELSQHPVDYNLALAALILLLSISGVRLFIYNKNKHSYWQRRGIRGPKPLPLVGNLFGILLSDRLKTQRDWAREFDGVYGVYYGFVPKLVIADPELMIQICIKDFEYFQNHDTIKFNLKIPNESLINLRDDRWKRVRALMSPTFTSTKVKKMFNIIDGCANELFGYFLEQMKLNGRVVNVKDVFGLFTLDVTSNCFFGLRFKRTGATNLKEAITRDKLVEDAIHCFDFSGWQFLLNLILPRYVSRVLNFKVEPANQLIDKVKPIIEKRRRSEQRSNDWLQLAVDARLGNKLELDENDKAENHHATTTHQTLEENHDGFLNDLAKKPESKQLNKVQLSEQELLTNTVTLVAVGVETTGTLLTHTTFALAFHQEIQQKLYDELLKIVELNEDKTKIEFHYEALCSCNYLDAVLSESLRLLSPIVLMNRRVSRDYYFEKLDLDLKAGDHVDLAFHALHTNPDFWQDPMSFDPERFMPENKDKIVTGSYVPFGLGPRHCLGMRIALTEGKLAIAKMIMSYRLEPAPGTSWPPESWPDLLLNKITNPSVKCVARE